MPERFAHGYQVLEDGTETSYQVGEFYTPACEGGLHYADPRLGLTWPLPVGEMSPKDAAWDLLDEDRAGAEAQDEQVSASLDRRRQGSTATHLTH